MIRRGQRRWSVRSKVALSSAAVVAVTGVVAWAGLQAASDVDGATGEITEKSIRSLTGLEDLIEMTERNFQETVRHSVLEDAQERAALARIIEESDDEIAAEIDELGDKEYRSDERATRARAIARELGATLAAYGETRNEKIMMQEDRDKAQEAAVGEVRDAFLRVRDLLSQLEGVETAEARALRSDARAALHSGRKLVVGAFAAAALLGLAIALFQSRRIAGA
ncbi:MAG: MCP four helix bundle domain-containing protein, partial [Actinomycetota bacterium]